MNINFVYFMLFMINTIMSDDEQRYKGAEGSARRCERRGIVGNCASVGGPVSGQRGEPQTSRRARP